MSRDAQRARLSRAALRTRDRQPAVATIEPETPNGAEVNSTVDVPVTAAPLDEPAPTRTIAAPATRRSPAIPLAALLIALLLVAVTVWSQGWFGLPEPKLPPASARNVQQIETTRPSFSGRLTNGTSATFSLAPSVPIRWTVRASDNDPGSFTTRVPVQLPDGEYQLTINGVPRATITIPAADANPNQPQIRAPLPAGQTAAVLEITPPMAMRWTVEAKDADGTYETVVPVELAPGLYTLLINDSPAQQFEVTEDAA